MDRSRLLPILLEHPRITMRWLVAGLAQLESTQRRVVRLMHRTVREQVAELLLEEADGFGEVHLSQSTLATLLGASRQSVNEALADLRKNGIAETGYRKVRIVDHAHLCGMVGSPAGVC
jgi:CRP-like cAMP-binding protein